MSESTELPPKTEVALALLQTALSVYVHLDPRPSEVRVPASFKKQAQLVLQVGLNMAVPIPDLDVGTDALTCTLSFNRKAEYCWIPWSAVYGLVGDDGRGMIWPDSVPPEVAAAAEGRPTNAKQENKRPRLRVAREGATSEEPASASPAAGAPRATTGRSGKKAAGRARTAATADAVVPPAAPQTAEADSSSATRQADATRSPDSKSAASTSTGTKRELPPYLRIVK